MADFFRGPLYVKTWWPEYLWQPALRTWTLNLLQSTLAPVLDTQDVQRGPLYIKVRWPEYEASFRSWSWNQTINMPTRLPPGKSSQVTERAPTSPYQNRQIDLNTWDWSYLLTLIGKDVLPRGKSTQATERTPTSPYQGRQIDLNTWRWSFPLNLIGKDRFPPGRQYSDRPPPVYWYQSWTLNLLQGTLSVAPAFPENQFDWPLPKAPPQPERTVAAAFPLVLIGQDQLPVGDQRTELAPGAFAPTVERRSWTSSYTLSLIGQDVITVGEQVTERPPLGPIQPLRTWTSSYLLTLIGQDRLPAGEQITDLVPRPPFEPATRTWTWSYNLNLIGQDQLPTGEQVYTLPPVGPYYDISLRTWITLVTSSGKPVAQYDWPTPKGYDFSVTLRSFTAWYNLNLIGQDAVTAGKQVTDRPQLAPIPPENLKTWIETVNLALVTSPGVPFSQNDWPLPRAPLQPQRGWGQSFPLELIGQDFITAGKAITDLAPRGTSPTDLRSWIAYTALSISSPTAPVGAVVSALPPLPPQPQAVGQATAFPLVLIGQDALPVGKQLSDLAPRGILATDYRSWVQFTSLALNNSLGVPVGDQLFERTPRAAQPAVDLGTWISAVKLLLPTPFSQSDWPTPKGPQVPQRTWINTPNLNLISAVKPFAQYDWPVPTPPQAPQRSFTASFPLELIGQDQLPIGRQIYDRTPPGYLFSQELRTSIHSPAVPPVVVVTSGGETLLMMGVG